MSNIYADGNVLLLSWPSRFRSSSSSIMTDLTKLWCRFVMYLWDNEVRVSLPRVRGGDMVSDVSDRFKGSKRPLRPEGTGP